MRGRTALRQTQPRNPSALETEQLRGQQVARDDDGPGRGLRRGAAVKTRQRQQYLRLEVQQVIDPLAQARIIQRAQRARLRTDHLPPGEAGALALSDQGARAGKQFRVLE